MPKIKVNTMDNLVKIGELETQVKETHKLITDFVQKAEGEIKATGDMSIETKNAIDKLSTKNVEVIDRLTALEQTGTKANQEGEKVETFGQMMAKSDGWAAFSNGRADRARLELKTAIVNASGQNQPLVPSDRLAGIIAPAQRRLTVRDVLPVGQTTSNLIEFCKENVYTNNAGPQYSSPNFENVTKPESAITFTLSSTAVRTLAHWIPVSKQVLADSPMLMSYIDGRLMYGLMLEEEDQIINGDGTGSNLSGLLDSGNYTAYNRTVTGDTYIDTLRRAMTQVAMSEFSATGILLNPEDWETIELQKDAEDRYIFAQPQTLAGPTMWGKQVIVTQSVAQGTFLVGAFDMAAQIWDRQQSAIEVSNSNGTDFVKNMVTILAEERLALAVYRPLALVGGSL